jgi:hypothetical protein
MKKHELADRVTAAVMREIHDVGTIERSRSFIPMSLSFIAAGATVPIKARPQIPFRGDRLAIWGGCAASFFIEGITVGNQYQGVASGTIPADAFATRLDLLPLLDAKFQKDGFVEVRISKKAEECFGQPLAMPLATVGTDITILVTNVSKEPQNFIGVILGDQEWR